MVATAKSKSATPKFKLDSIKKPVKKQATKKQQKTAQLNEAKKLSKKKAISETVSNESNKQKCAGIPIDFSSTISYCVFCSLH